MKIYKSDCPEIKLSLKRGDIKKAKLTCAHDVYQFLMGITDDGSLALYESFYAVYLNRAANTMAWIKISQGGFSGTIADPRMIIKPALDIGASSIIISHNHPSGNLKPSATDISMTKKIKDAAKLFDIALLDHLIITEESYYSFTDSGTLAF